MFVENKHLTETQRVFHSEVKKNDIRLTNVTNNFKNDVWLTVVGVKCKRLGVKGLRSIHCNSPKH